MKNTCKICGENTSENNKIIICPICGETICEACGCHCDKCGTVTCEKCNHDHNDNYYCATCLDKEITEYNSNIDKQIKELKKTIKLLESLKK